MVMKLGERKTLSLLGITLLGLGLSWSIVFANPSVDELPDITGGVQPIVQYKNTDAFAGTRLTSVENVEYVVHVKNQTGDPLVADSLVLVVDTLQEISGKEISDQVRIEGFDGKTREGKPFFRIPSDKAELAPYSESQSVTIRVSNPNYHRFFPPNVRVRGLRRAPGKAVETLLDSLVRKGILAPDEAARALESTSSSNP